MLYVNKIQVHRLFFSRLILSFLISKNFFELTFHVKGKIFLIKLSSFMFYKDMEIIKIP